jgi:hypothetical protein
MLDRSSRSHIVELDHKSLIVERRWFNPLQHGNARNVSALELPAIGRSDLRHHPHNCCGSAARTTVTDAAVVVDAD